MKFIVIVLVKMRLKLLQRCTFIFHLEMMEIAITIVSTRRWSFPLREQDHDVLLQTVRLQAALVSNLNGKG